MTSSMATSEAAAIGGFVADRIVRCHLKTMARINVDYDLLTWEGDILRLKFWAAGVQLYSRPAAPCTCRPRAGSRDAG